MKKITLLITIVVINIASLTAQTIDKLDEKNGYKDLQFGTPKSELQSKIFDCTPQGNCMFIGDYNIIADYIFLQNVWGQFSDNKLSSIILDVRGEKNTLNLFELFCQAYGTPTKSDKDAGEWFWEGKQVTLMFMTIVGDDNILTANVVMLSNKLSNNKKAIGDL